jgi:hypothetical protein
MDNVVWGLKKAPKKAYIQHVEVYCVYLCTIMIQLLQFEGNAVAQLFEGLYYKPEGRGFDYRWCHWNFSLT